MSSLRVSSYVISIPLEDTADQYMLIHGYTGAIDIATKELATALRENKEFSEEDSPFGKELLASLKQRGYVTDKSAEEEYAYTAHLADVLHRARKALYKGFTFLISYNCNFRCPYCYEGSMSGNGENWSKRTFTKEMADRAFDAMLRIEPRRELHSKVITLYGGEPLLKENKEIVSYIVRKGKGLGYSFFAITNGYDLEAYEDLLGANLIEKLQITVDGCKERHNARRRHFQDGATFDQIIQNIGLALAKDCSVSVRVNTDANVFNDLKLLHQLFTELHYTEKKGFSMYSALLQNSNPAGLVSKSDSLKFLSVGEFMQKHKDANFLYGCQDFGAYRKIISALQNKTFINLSSTFCGAQIGSYVLDPQGDIYACWETVGKPELILGHYSDSEIHWTSTVKQWQTHNSSRSKICYACKYSLLCGGGCLAHHVKSQIEFELQKCEKYPIRFRYAANRAYHDFMTGM